MGRAPKFQTHPLRSVEKLLGISARELAKECGISASSLKHLKSGRGEKLGELARAKIAAATGVDPNSILRHDTKPSTIWGVPYSRRSLNLFNKYRAQIGPRLRRQAKDRILIEMEGALAAAEATKRSEAFLLDFEAWFRDALKRFDLEGAATAQTQRIFDRRKKTDFRSPDQNEWLETTIKQFGLNIANPEDSKVIQRLRQFKRPEFYENNAIRVAEHKFQVKAPVSSIQAHQIQSWIQNSRSGRRLTGAELMRRDFERQVKRAQAGVAK